MNPNEPTPTPKSGTTASERLSGETLRDATFPQALRGYDRESVHALLDRVADWVEGRAGAMADRAPAMKEEFAKVGERTAGILTAAEDAARNLRDEAIDYAERLRAEAEEEARKQRQNASQRMDEMIADAEAKAEKVIDDALARRRNLNQAISSLVERRDEIASDVERLADELLGAVEGMRSISTEESVADAELADAERTHEEATFDEFAVEEETAKDERPVDAEPVDEERLMDEERPVDEEETPHVADPDLEETRFHDPEVTQPHPPPPPRDDRT